MCENRTEYGKNASFLSAFLVGQDRTQSTVETTSVNYWYVSSSYPAPREPGNAHKLPAIHKAYRRGCGRRGKPGAHFPLFGPDFQIS
jgi:hypothetical protein